MGNYHGTSSKFVTVLQGIQNAVGENTRVLYSEGCDLWKENISNLADPFYPDRLSEVQTVADYSDVMVVVLGLDETLEGEEGDTGNQFSSGDKNDLNLPLSQRLLLNAVLETGKPTIVINMSGSAIDLSLAEKKAAAVIQAWYPGARGGNDVASILFGEVSPSGKLPVTFYGDGKDLPDFTDYSMKNRTYRYYEGVAEYPFGYGLTYGDCAASDMEVTLTEDGGADLKVTVANKGKVATDDVLQIYIKDVDFAQAVRNHSLCGFKRVHLESGEEKVVELHIDRRAFTSVDEDGKREIFSKNFKLFAGFSQPDKRSAELTGHECVCKDVVLK